MSSASLAAYSNPIPSANRSSGPRRRSRYLLLSPGQYLHDGLVLFLIALPPWVGVWMFGGVRLWSIGPLMGVVFLATALAALRFVRERDGLGGRCPPGFLALALFVAYGFLLIPRAAVPYDAFVESLKVASYLGAYWVWSELSGWQGRWRWITAGFLLVVTVMAWYAIIQHMQGERGVLNLIRPDDYGMRASGAYFCPNHFANLLDMTIPFAAAIAVSPVAGLPLRLLAGYSVLVALAPLYLTQSRSGWIGTAVGLVVIVALLGLRRGVRRFLVRLMVAPVVVAGAGFLVWLASPMVQTRVADALAGNIRLKLWRDTWGMILDQPWLGWGPAAFRWVYPHYWFNLNTFLDPEFAHNDYLQAWVEYGVVGLVLLVGALALGVGRLLVHVRRSDSDRSATLIIAFLGALAATSAHAAFDYNFHIYGNVQVLVMMAGLAAGAWGREEERIPAPSPVARRWIAGSGVLALVLLGLTVQAVTTYAFALKGDFALDDYKLDVAQRNYERALQVEPHNWRAHLGLGHLWAGQAFWNRDPETRTEQIEKAEIAYRAVQSYNRWETESKSGLSRVYNLRGQPEQALQVLEEVLEIMPHQRDFMNQLGLQLRQMGRLEEALAAFKRARAYGPHSLTDANIAALTRKLERQAQQASP